ncbi:PEGA domain-containing protein [candidate division WOR-3 bacterium]|nr:PEGA domain-containing protein [candidate division WOR-3 bacterium]
MIDMAKSFSLPRSICKSGWGFKRISGLIFLLLSATGYSGMNVVINEFVLEGSGDIIISPSEITSLLWRGLEEDTRFDVGFNRDSTDSADFIIDGRCNITGSNYFEIDWTITNPAGSVTEEFSHEGNGLKQAREELVASLDEMLAPLVITTYPDSASVTIDGLFMGKSPITLTDDIPIGRHHFEAITPEGLVYKDSFYLTNDSTTFHFTLPQEPKSEIAYLKILSPPKCRLYVNGSHIPATHNLMYELQPGENEIRLISPQYGTRNLKLSMEPGDTVSLGFFTPLP